MAQERPRDTHPEHREIPVSFPSTDGRVTLAGTLAIPPGGRAAQAVVLVSGTGPIDRDVTFVGHALFRTLAQHLAERGVASLRFDKRRVGESRGDFSLATAEGTMLCGRSPCSRAGASSVTASSIGTCHSWTRFSRSPGRRAIGAGTRGGGAGCDAGASHRQRANSRDLGLEEALGLGSQQVVPLVMCPVLVVYGDRDVQVPACENVSAARALVDELGKSTGQSGNLPT